MTAISMRTNAKSVTDDVETAQGPFGLEEPLVAEEISAPIDDGDF